MFSALHPDLINYMTPYLDANSISNLSLTSTFFNSKIDNDIYLKKISEDFNIPVNFVREQRHSLLSNSINFIDVYKNLRALKRNYKILPIGIKHSYEDENNYPFIFACCTNNIKYFCSIVPYDEHSLWAIMSLYAGCDKLIIFSTNCYRIMSFPNDAAHDTNQKTRLDWTARAGQKDIFIHLLNHKNFTARPDITTLTSVACSGNIPLVRYLLDPDNQFNLKVDGSPEGKETPLEKAAYYGHLELVKLLVSMGAKVTPATLFNAIASRNIKLFGFLTDSPESKFEKDDTVSCFETSFSILTELASGLNLSDNQIEDGRHGVMNFFLGNIPEFQQEYFESNKEYFQDGNDDFLNEDLAVSGNIDILKKFIDTSANFKPDQTCLKSATSNGHLKMVRFLIEDLKIEPTQSTLVCAQLAGHNTSLVKYLLDRNKFSLFVNQEILNECEETFSLNYYRSSISLNAGLNVCRSDINDYDIEITDEIKEYFLDSFLYTPHFHLNSIFIMLEKPEHHKLNETSTRLIHEHLSDLSSMDLNEYFPPEYCDVYSKEIKNLINHINARPAICQPNA